MNEIAITALSLATCLALTVAIIFGWTTVIQRKKIAMLIKHTENIMENYRLLEEQRSILRRQNEAYRQRIEHEIKNKK